MLIDLKDPRVTMAVAYLKEQNKGITDKELELLMEEVYHCKIISDPDDPFCNHGWLKISEAKYQAWFVLKFGPK